MRWTRAATTALVTAALVLGAPGCGDDDEEAPTAGTAETTTSTTAATTSTTSATTTSTGGATTVTEPDDDVGDSEQTGRSELEDGRHFGYWSSVEATGTGAAGELDLAYFLTGEEAEAEAAARGDEVNNDYYVVNDNPRLRTLVIAPDVEVQVLESTGGATLVASDVGRFVDERHEGSGFWVTIEDGLVTAIQEQYVP